MSCPGKTRLLVAMLLNKLNLLLCMGKLMPAWPTEATQAFAFTGRNAIPAQLMPCLSICCDTDSLVRAWPHAWFGTPLLPGYCKHCDIVSRLAELSGALQEAVHCFKCSATTHDHEYVQCFYVVMTTAIVNQET